MDLIREVLGDRKMHYFGISYGTELGGVYAHLFPTRIGRSVLDAVVDPTADSVGHAKNQTLGFQRALDDYLKSTGQDPKQGSREIADLLKRIDAKPLPTSSGRKLTRAWPSPASSCRSTARTAGPPHHRPAVGPVGRRLGAAEARRLLQRAGRLGPLRHDDALPARVISCLDDKQRPTAQQMKKLLPEFEKISPVFGDFLGWDTAGWCHDWPVAGEFDHPEVSAPGAAPVLVVGNTGDPATPYEGAQKMADGLGKGVGVLLTWKGEGHGRTGAAATASTRR